MTKCKSMKRQSPAVYVKRVESDVYIPIRRNGYNADDNIEVLCYRQFSRITGIKLKDEEIAKVRITGKKVKR